MSFSSIIRTGLPILVDLIDLVNSVIIFLSQMVNFPTRILDWDLMVLLFWIYFLLLTLVFVLQWISLHWEILIILLSQCSLTFLLIHNDVGTMLFLHYFSAEYRWTVCRELAGDNFSTDAF